MNIGAPTPSTHSLSPTRNFGRKKLFTRPNIKFPFSPKIFLPLLLLVILIGGFVLFRNTQTTVSTSNTSSSGEKPAAPVIKQKQILNKEFSFPIKDANNKELSQIKYMVQAASLQDEILVKGQRARAIEGRTFLILDLRITNNFNQGIQINSKDYIRLTVNGNKNELIAADIHNDPVEVQAISTKLTRVGFPINETDTDLILQIGEIKGKKEQIKITF